MRWETSDSMTSSPSHRLADATCRWDRVFAVLSAGPRRQIIDELITVPASDSISLPGAISDSSTSSVNDQLRLQLRHRHLPLLEAEGIVQWETDPLRASRGADFEDVSVVLESLYANAAEIPDQLVIGCNPFERERADGNAESGRGK